MVHGEDVGGGEGRDVGRASGQAQPVLGEHVEGEAVPDRVKVLAGADSPGESPAPRSSRVSELEAAEAQKLRAEAKNLEEQSKQLAWRSWSVRVLIPTLLGSCVAAWASAFFADSLEERTRAEIRRDVLETYFDVSNDSAGKREQILDFIEVAVADDAALVEWVEQERPRVEEAKRLADAEAAKASARLEEIDARLASLKEHRASVLAFLESSQASAGWLEVKPRSAGRVAPGVVGKLLDAEQNARLMDFIEIVGVADLPALGNYGGRCNELALALDIARSIPAEPQPEDGEPANDEGQGAPSPDGLVERADACRGELLDWALKASEAAEGRLRGQEEQVQAALAASVGRGLAGIGEVETPGSAPG